MCDGLYTHKIKIAFTSVCQLLSVDLVRVVVVRGNGFRYKLLPLIPVSSGPISCNVCVWGGGGGCEWGLGGRLSGS